MSIAPAPPPDELAGFLGASGHAPGEPYRGLEPFSFADAGILAAREAEIERLVRLVTMYRGVLLYGESGAGKTSVVNAGLLPRLVKEGYWPHRVRVQPREDQELVLEPIRASATEFLPSAFDGVGPDGQLVVGAKAFPAAVDAATAHGRIVLVFDQFEELVTLFDEASASAGAARVVDAIVRILRDRDVRVKMVFVFREDYLASLEPLLAEQPELADQSLRLVLPPVDSAREIIRVPFERFAEAFPRELTPELAGRIAASLSQRSRGTGLNLSELQVVCRRLWEADDPAALLAARGVEGLLEDFLNERLQAFGRADSDLAVALLTRLVTTSDTRNVVSRDDLLVGACKETGRDVEVAERTLVRLEHEAHLVRSERRRDVTTFEIVSEFLVPMIARRKAERRSTAEAERALAEAAERHREELAARRRTLRRVGTALAVVVVAILSTLAVYAWDQRGKAEDARDQAKTESASATAHELAASADGAAQGDPALAEALAMKALTLRWTPGAESALRSAISLPSPALTLAGADSTDGSCCATFTRDGRFVVAASGGAVRVWDAASGKLRRTIKQSSQSGAAPDVRPDGAALIVKGGGGALREVALGTNEPARRFQGDIQGGYFASGNYSPDGSKVAFPGLDGSVYVWRTDTRKLLYRLATGYGYRPGYRYRRFLVDAQFTGDGRGIMTVSLTGLLQAWALPSGQPRWSLGGVRRVTVAPRSNLAAIVKWNGQTELRDTRDGRLVGRLGGPKFAGDLAAFTPNGRVLAVRGRRGAAKSSQSVGVWSVPGRRPLGTIAAGATINDIALRPDGRLLATAQSGGVVLWDVRSGAALAHLGASTAAAWSVAFSAGGSRLVTATEDGSVRVWKLDEVLSSTVLTATKLPVWSTAFSPAGDRVAVASRRGTVTVATVPGGKRIHTLRVSPGKEVWMVAFSPDGRLLATGSESGKAQLWDRSGKLVQSVASGGGAASVAFSRDGRSFVTGGSDSVRVWTTASGVLEHKLAVGEQVQDAVISPDGSQVAAAIDDGRVIIWDRRTGHRKYTLPSGPDDSAYVVAYSRDGHYLAEGNSSGAVLLWNARTGKRVASLVGHTDAVTVVQFMADGRHLLSAGDDGKARVWDLHARIGAVVASWIRTGASVALSADGHWLSAATKGSGALLTECRGCLALNDLEARARPMVRALTAPERQKYLHAGEPERPTPFS
jgi:WD40 repeat protein